MSNQLTPQESTWLADLIPQVAAFKNCSNWSYEQRQSALEKMCRIAEQLHDSLKNRNLEPQHSKHLIANRKKDTKNKFYHNLHALEDLVAFTSRISINDADGDTKYQ